MTELALTDAARAHFVVQATTEVVVSRFLSVGRLSILAVSRIDALFTKPVEAEGVADSVASQAGERETARSSSTGP